MEEKHMMWIGDVIVLLTSLVALIYGIKIVISKKTVLYFQIILCAVGCHIVGYAFDLSEVLTAGTVSEGLNIGYLGNIGCFLFLLTANFGCLDGIIDDGSSIMKKSRFLALLAPLAVAILYIPNMLSLVPVITKLAYLPVWLVAAFTSYMHLKHVLVPDMGFGFVKAIRPFNIAALVFTVMELIHLTLWNYNSWIALMISGILLGSSVIAMIVTMDKGVRKWTI